MFFFFKQKTAYEVRISDWSSDVCSSDLGTCIGTRTIVEVETAEGIPGVAHMEVRPLYQPGEVEHMMWSVEGAPSSSITIERKDSRHATASSMFNRIPDVIAAPPGIQFVSPPGVMRHSQLTGA